MECKKELMDFLLFSYFGIIPESIYNDPEYPKNGFDSYKDYCTKMVIIKAYDDATNEGAYNALFKKEILDMGDLKDKSNKVKKEAAKVLLSAITKLEEIEDFDSWHNKLCNDIVKRYSEVNYVQTLFSYGNAQKWVNMSLKYLWLLGLLPDCIKEDYLHIPIDSYIIDALWKDNPNIEFPIKDKKTKRDKNYSKPSEYVQPWSKWGYDEYYKCLKSIRECIETQYNLTWENNEWIKTAEARKQKKQKKIMGFFGD